MKLAHSTAELYMWAPKYIFEWFSIYNTTFSHLNSISVYCWVLFLRIMLFAKIMLEKSILLWSWTQKNTLTIGLFMNGTFVWENWLRSYQVFHRVDFKEILSPSFFLYFLKLWHRFVLISDNHVYQVQCSLDLLFLYSKCVKQIRSSLKTVYDKWMNNCQQGFHWQTTQTG